MQYMIYQWTTNRFRPSELTKHHPRCPLTKRAILARLLANKGPAIYVVHLNRYFVIPP